MKKIIAVVGDAICDEGSKKWNLAFATGKALIDAGYRIQSGGKDGIMLAAFLGAKSSENYREGDTIGILPGFYRDTVSCIADIIIPTGLDIARNILVANADAVIAIGGGAGTLSEIAFAWTLQKLILPYRNVDGWSAKMADIRIDSRIRYENIPEDKAYGIDTPADAIALLQKYLPLYTNYHKGIK
ncbi:MAG: LOG family protein [Christensenellaceae bacterium]|jgi:uncharacterized protein (TIGR00725 family)|nr:LOG family protein [Christensenellaceae bacterium]